MKYLILAAAFLLGFAIVRADTYTKIDPNTVQVAPPPQIVSPDQLSQQIQSLQSLIVRANAEKKSFDDRVNADIVFWQAKIDEINNAAAQMGIVLK